MSILDIFRSAPPAAPVQPAVPQVPQQQQADPNNLNTQANGVTGANGIVPDGSSTVESPLSQFKDLWEPVTDDKGNPVAPASERYINIDPAKVMESAKKVDFAKLIPQEHFQAVAAGGEGAMQAMMAIINTLGQTLYAQSAITSANLTEQTMGNAANRFAASVPDMIKQHQVSDSLRSEHPVFSNPATQPLLQLVEAQMTAKYPNATVSDIKRSAQDYITQFAGAITAGNDAASGKGKQKINPAEDWESFFSEANN
jgi:hypothetical protein